MANNNGETIDLELVTNITRPCSKDDAAVWQERLARLSKSISLADNPHSELLIAQLVEPFTLREARRVKLVVRSTKSGIVKLADSIWQDVDEILRFIRAKVLVLVRDRIASIIDNLGDPVSCCMHARQLAELVYWYCTYYYGVTTAYNQIVKFARKHENSVIVCADLENLVRGAVALDTDRTAKWQQAMGLGGLDPAIKEVLDRQVIELEWQIKKLKAITRFLAGRRFPSANSHLKSVAEPGIIQHVDRLDAAYSACCSYVHVTPLLLSRVGEPDATIGKEAAFVAITTILSGLVVLAVLAYPPEAKHIDFKSFVRGRRALPGRSPMMLKIPMLKDFINPRKKLVFETGQGPLVVFDPKAS